MGLFPKRKSKTSKVPSSEETERSNGTTSAVTPTKREPPRKLKPEKLPSASLEPVDVKMEKLPQLVTDLENCTDTSGDKPARALRILFSLSEHATDSENRTTLVREADGQLIPVLLEFLCRCERGSSEQYLALLVLNNVSIPSENKRLIAMDYGGAQVFSRLLCEDPSCHLMAIILVNLTFADAELRKELVNLGTDIHIVEALAYTLRVASMTSDEYESRQPLPTGNSPRDLLKLLMEEDKRLRPALSDLDHNSGNGFGHHHVLTDPSKQLFPETARWCLSALKNLTRPSKDATAAHAVIHSGIVPLILGFVTVRGGVSLADSVEQPSENDGSSPTNGSSPANSTDSTPSPTDPEDDPMMQFANAPTSWDSNSIQDAALFVVLNLCATGGARDYMQEVDTVNTLALIPAYGLSVGFESLGLDESKVLNFQCLKARMAMGYLLGSSGHFGQPRPRNASNSFMINPADSVLNLTETEVELLVELLANTLHQRVKEGPGGYSAATFNVKVVIFAVRCLLTNPFNRLRFVNTAGCKLNILLLKALAQHALLDSSNMDPEAAEHACFSLYLQSDHGFQAPFLAAIYGDHDKIAGTGSLAAKVLTSYLHKENITPPGRHAADQLLLRLRYLVFKGTVAQLSPSRLGAAFTASDHAFDDALMESIEKIHVERRICGARPKREIFDRPILRSRAPKRGSSRAPWESGAAVSVFPCALEAVKQLSYNSTKVRHMDAIDDIAIANNIAKSADGEKTESYNYWWSWKDAAGEITRNLERQTSVDSVFSNFTSKSPAIVSDKSAEPLTFLEALRCGGPMMCGADTTVKDE